MTNEDKPVEEVDPVLAALRNADALRNESRRLDSEALVTMAETIYTLHLQLLKLTLEVAKLKGETEND
jgi:hypothetical protein